MERMAGPCACMTPLKSETAERSDDKGSWHRGSLALPPQGYLGTEVERYGRSDPRALGGPVLEALSEKRCNVSNSTATNEGIPGTTNGRNHDAVRTLNSKHFSALEE